MSRDKLYQAGAAGNYGFPTGQVMAFHQYHSGSPTTQLKNRTHLRDILPGLISEQGTSINRHCKKWKYLWEYLYSLGVQSLQ